jgi:hypothetical protein
VPTFSYTHVENSRGEAAIQPFLPAELRLGESRVEVSGLLDSGSAINVLPFDVGVRLGADWDRSSPLVRLTGNLASAEARVLVAHATPPGLPDVRLAFAWTRSNDVPVIFGQVNFFMEFDVCFFRSRQEFDVRPKAGPHG